MTAFTATMTTVSDVDHSIVLAYDQAFMVANGQDANLDQLVTVRKNIGAKSIEFPRYSRLAAATTPLTETDDPASVALVDAQVILTPVEYGNVVTTTKLANLQTGGTADVAAATLVGLNARMTQDELIIAAALAGTNALTINDTAAASIAGTEIATRSFVNRFYNKLARANVPTINGAYVAIMHDDVINDLRNDTAAGSWVDVNKYATPETVLFNEVGMIAGFRVIRNNSASLIETDGGSGAVDNYVSFFLGANALGKAVSKEVTLTMTGPFDKLSRFVNMGWYGVMQYKIVDASCIWEGRCAASVGSNA